MIERKKILLSGVKPSGLSHIGNYFGAMRQFVDFQKEYQCFVFIADYHALNFIQNKEEMKENTLGIALDYLAIGLDPAHVTLFKQSDVGEHTELAWIFDTITTMPYLMRAHAYKDAEAKGKEVLVGTFNYPMLMAADILLYDADIVPIGQDQKQHVEYARDTAEKFNRIYGDTFKLPTELIQKEVAIVPGTDGRKMSKSYGNVIPLFANRSEIEKGVMGIVTNSSGDFPEHVYAIHKLYKSESELKSLYEKDKGNYKVLKEALIEDIDAFIEPMRKRRQEIASDPAYIENVLKEGGEKARAVASKKMKIVRERIGVRS
jgi:tryptophanyl-tRNA synthetase